MTEAIGLTNPLGAVIATKTCEKRIAGHGRVRFAVADPHVIHRR